MKHQDQHTTVDFDACMRCYQTCLDTAMTHCLEAGGKFVEPTHFRLLMACAEVCRTTAYLMTLKSAHAKHICKICAELCDQCAKSCESLGDMKECVAACRHCAEACRKMAA